MDIYAKISQAIKGIIGEQQSAIFPAQVKSINGTTCTVLVGELELTDVRLRAVENNNDEQILITPKTDSHVLVADLSAGEYRDLAIISYSEVEKIEIKVGSAEVIVKDGKVSVKNDRQNLYSLLTDLIDAILALTVTTGTGASGTPVNSAQFSAIKTQLGQLMQ